VLSFLKITEMNVKDKELAPDIYLSQLHRGYIFDELAVQGALREKQQVHMLLYVEKFF